MSDELPYTVNPYMDTLPEREPATNTSRCVHCLAWITYAEFHENDYLCTTCAARPESWPLGSTT